MATGTNADPEKAVYRDGYPELAAWIAKDPDGETLIFRKFDCLGARILLHLQSELMSLEAELNRLDETARQSRDPDLRQLIGFWEKWIQSAESGRAEEKNRLNLCEKIQKKLQVYHDTLLRQSQISSLGRPSSRTIEGYRPWFEGSQLSDGSNLKQVIYGQADSMLKDVNDLAALRPPPDQDTLSRVIRDHWPLEDKSTCDPYGIQKFYQEKHIIWVVNILSMILATILLIGAVVGLYLVKRPVTRLVMISVFTVVFAASIGLLTNARRPEIFAATAAYAAVLVVFVSGNLGGTSN